jgi:hypothetical protein
MKILNKQFSEGLAPFIIPLTAAFYVLCDNEHRSDCLSRYVGCFAARLRLRSQGGSVCGQVLV